MLSVLLIIVNIYCASTNAEDDAIKKMNRVFYFQLTGWINDDNLLYDKKTCCDRSTVQPCKACPSGVYTDWTNFEGRINRYAFQTLSVDHSSRFDLFQYIYKVDSSEVKRIDITLRQRNSQDLYDFWYGANMDVIGLYPMNGVWGIHYNAFMIASVEVYVPSPFKYYASFNIYINKITWISRRYTTGECCSDISSNCQHSCNLAAEASIGSIILDKFLPSGYEITNTSYFVKMSSGTIDSGIRRENLTISIRFVHNNTRRLIDTLTFNDINLYSGKELEIFDKTGSSNAIKLDVVFKIDCNGYVGKNCKYTCNYDSDIVRCRSDDGKPFCVNGASDVPTCKNEIINPCTNNPCENNGDCEKFRNSTLCNCKKGFSGRYCETLNCQADCYKGTCSLDGLCSCSEGYKGQWCDESDCTDLESSVCKNLAQCKRVRDQPVCLCASHSTGADCSTPLCDPECISGLCQFTGPTSSSCVCVDGYIGSNCGTARQSGSLYNTEGTVYVIAIFSALLVLALKLFFMSVLATVSIQALFPFKRRVPVQSQAQEYAL